MSELKAGAEQDTFDEMALRIAAELDLLGASVTLANVKTGEKVLEYARRLRAGGCGAQGMVSVPIEPTQEMCEAAYAAMQEGPEDIWASMIEARPK